MISFLYRYIIWRSIDTLLYCKMLERIVLGLALFHSPAKECAEFCEYIVDSILTARLRSTSLWKCIINRFICTRADELARFLIAGKESMLLPQECLEFAKYIQRHRIKTQMKPLGYIDTPI